MPWFGLIRVYVVTWTDTNNANMSIGQQAHLVSWENSMYSFVDISYSFTTDHPPPVQSSGTTWRQLPQSL